MDRKPRCQYQTSSRSLRSALSDSGLFESSVFHLLSLFLCGRNILDYLLFTSIHNQLDASSWGKFQQLFDLLATYLDFVVCRHHSFCRLAQTPGNRLFYRWITQYVHLNSMNPGTEAAPTTDEVIPPRLGGEREESGSALFYHNVTKCFKRERARKWEWFSFWTRW